MPSEIYPALTVPTLAELLAKPGVRAGFDRALFADSPVPMALCTSDGVLFDANAAFCDLLGHARSEFVGHSYDWFTLPPDLPGDQAEFARLVAGEQHRYSLSKRYLTKFGQVVCVDLTVQRVDGAPDVFELAVAHALPAAVSPEFLRPTTTRDGRPAYRATVSVRAILEDWFRSVGVSNRVGYTAVWSALTTVAVWLATVTSGTVGGYLTQRDELARVRATLEAKSATVDDLRADLKQTLANQARGEDERRRLAAQVDALLRLGQRIESQTKPPKE